MIELMLAILAAWWVRLADAARRRGLGKSIGITSLMRPGERVITITRSERNTASSTL